MRLTPSVEDYLRTIHDLEREEGRASTSNIAERMEVTKASATNMVKRLAKMGLADHEAYKGVALTRAGEKVALEVIRHHRLLELYLTQALGMGWDQVHKEADRLEHHISEELEAAISEALGHPTHDPHGDPIPTVDLEWPNVEGGAPLLDQAPGATVEVRRVQDQAPNTLRKLADLGLVPGTRCTLRRVDTDLGIVELLIGDEAVHLSTTLAGDILVRPTP